MWQFLLFTTAAITFFRVSSVDYSFKASSHVPSFILLFSVDATLLGCDKHSGHCVLNEDALEFLNWVSNPSYSKGNFDPHLIAWTNHGGTIRKFDSAMKSFHHENKLKLSLQSSSMGIYNLTSYFTGPEGIDEPKIIELHTSIEWGILGPLMSKDMMQLRDRLLFTDDVSDVGVKIMLLFDHDETVHYQYNICFRQSYRQGLLPILVDDFRYPTRQDKGIGSSKFRFSEIRAILSQLFVDHRGVIPITMNELLERFEPPPHIRCGYRLQDPDRFYSALVIDLGLLYGLPVPSMAQLFSNFFDFLIKLRRTMIGNSIDALLFSCDNSLMGASICDALEYVFQWEFDKLTLKTAEKKAAHWIHYLPVVRFLRTGFWYFGNRQSPPRDTIELGIGSGLPRRTSLILKMGGTTDQYPDPRQHNAEGGSNICYVRARRMPKDARRQVSFSQIQTEADEGNPMLPQDTATQSSKAPDILTLDTIPPIEKVQDAVTSSRPGDPLTSPKPGDPPTSPKPGDPPTSPKPGDSPESKPGDQTSPKPGDPPTALPQNPTEVSKKPPETENPLLKESFITTMIQLLGALKAVRVELAVSQVIGITDIVDTMDKLKNRIPGQLACFPLTL